MGKEISLTDYQEVVKKATKVILAAQEHFLRQSNQTSTPSNKFFRMI
jgi:hypothetical protein